MSVVSGAQACSFFPQVSLLRGRSCRVFALDRAVDLPDLRRGVLAHHELPVPDDLAGRRLALGLVRWEGSGQYLPPVEFALLSSLRELSRPFPIRKRRPAPRVSLRERVSATCNG